MNKKSDILIDKGHRKSTQFVMPVNKPDFPKKASYDIYPEFEIEEQIHQGFFSLANEIKVFSKVCIDGYCGVDWEHLISNLKSSFKKLGVSCKFINIQEFYKSEKEIGTFLAPFLKPDDP